MPATARTSGFGGGGRARGGRTAGSRGRCERVGRITDARRRGTLRRVRRAAPGAGRGRSRTTSTTPAWWSARRRAGRGMAERDAPGDHDAGGIATSVNDRGLVVGEMTVAGRPHAFKWKDGKLTSLSNAIASTAQGVNDAGWIVGFAEIELGDRAILWRNGKQSRLPTPPAGDTSRAREVNNAGQIVGGIQGIGAVRWWHGGPNLCTTAEAAPRTTPTPCPSTRSATSWAAGPRTASPCPGSGIRGWT